MIIGGGAAAQAEAWALGWPALAAVGTILSAVVALGLGLLPTMVLRRSWRRVTYSARTVQESGSIPLTRVVIRNGGARAIVDVVVPLLDEGRDDPARDDRMIDHLAGGERQVLAFPSWVSTPSAEPTARFTDWRGKRFEIVKRGEEFVVRPARQSRSST